MKKMNLRRALLLASLLVPAAVVIVAAALQLWSVAATAATLLLTAVGGLSLITLGEVRGLKRRSHQQSKKLSHLTKAASRSRIGQQRLLSASVKAIRKDLAPLTTRVEQLSNETAATRARAEHAERRLIGVMESLRLDSSKASDTSPKITALQKTIRADLRAVEKTLSNETKSAASSTVNKTVTRLTSVARDETQQVEALLQLLPRITPTAPLPPSGQWALDARTLLHLSHLCETLAPRNLVELGGGTSTVWLAYLLRETDAVITSLDHDPGWARLTQESIERHRLTGGQLRFRTAPLEPIHLSGETYNWYALEAFNDITAVDFLLVDGPPKASGSLARYPALPALHDRLARRCTVALDDSDRPDEVRAVERWLEEYAGFARVDEGVSRLTVLRRNA